MIVVRRERPDDFRVASRGLLGWLHADGVLVIPADLRPAEDAVNDEFAAQLTAALEGRR
jgi:hypothetical protein